MIPFTWAIGLLFWVSEYNLTLPSECPEYMTGYIVLQVRHFTGFPQDIERIFVAFYTYHIFSCLSSDPDIHFYLDDVQDTAFTLYPCPTKLCSCFPVLVEKTWTDLSEDPANNLSPE